MKRTLLCIASLLAACVLLAACNRRPGSEDSGSGENAPVPTAEATATPEPTPTLPPYEPNILTGAARDENYAVDQRPVAIMINNITQARPQRGISNADILVEIEVEGGITRLMGIFQNYKTLGEVGPIRSARDQYLQLILPRRMLYIHEGQSIPTAWMLNGYLDQGMFDPLLNIEHFGSLGYAHRLSRYNWNGMNWFYYNSSNCRETEHTMYTSGEYIQKYVENNSVDMTDTSASTFFNFVDYRLENPVRDLANSRDSAYTTANYGDVVTPAEYVEISHCESRLFRTRFIYDSANAVYKMEQWYDGVGWLQGDNRWRATIDELYNDLQLTFTNVIILFTDIHEYPAGYDDPESPSASLKDVDYDSGGAGYYFYGGKAERIYWTKGGPDQPLYLWYLDEDGKNSGAQLEVNTGKTYLSIVDLDLYGGNYFKHMTMAEAEADPSIDMSTAAFNVDNAYRMQSTVTIPASCTQLNTVTRYSTAVAPKVSHTETPETTEGETTDGEATEGESSEGDGADHEHTFDDRGNCTICGLYVPELDPLYTPPAE